MLEKLLKTLSDELKLPMPPTLDKERIYTFSLNPDLEIKVKELDSGSVLLAKIGPCPQIKKEELFALLLKANFLGQGTGSSSIGLEESENSLTLSSHLPYDMNYKMFRDALEDFVNYIEYWKAQLLRHQKAAEESIL